MFFNADMKPVFNIQIEKLTYGGDAMGRLPDGRAVFIPLGLPNERVRVRLTEEKRGFARGELIKILEPSKDRINPKCKHFGACGGCHYQNLPYEKQLEAKTEILRDQLTRIGKIENPPVRLMVPCPNTWNYRNHVQFHLTEGGKLGFVDLTPSPNKRRGEHVMPISECYLPEPSINTLWPLLEFEPNTNIERVSLRSGKDEDIMLVLESDSPETPELEIEAGISVAHVYEGDTAIIVGDDHSIIRILDRDFRVSAASFFQVNTVMAEKMVEHILAKLPISQSTELLDVYCGAGLFSAFLAPKCKCLIGIESSPFACEDFAVNLDGFDNVELYEGTAEDVIPHLEAKPDIVLLDPPRAGVERHTLDGILRLEPHVVAYVSCDPSTLARDAKRLVEAGYQLIQVTPFDLFPQTYHIESISFFER